MVEKHKTRKNQQIFYKCNMCNNTIKITFYCITTRKAAKGISCTLRSWVHQISMLFRIFYPGLEDIDTFQCSSDSFPHWPHISGCVQIWQNYISMSHCSPMRGECPENLSRICPIVMCLFRTFSPQLENIDTTKCGSDSFAHTQRYVVNVENCQN